MKNILQAPLTKAGIRTILGEIQQNTQLSYLEISKRTGVHFTTIYNILRPTAGDSRVKVQLNTVRKLADSLGYELEYNARNNSIILRPTGKAIIRKTSEPKDQLDRFGMEIAAYLRSIGMQKVTTVQRRKVKQMLKLLLV